MAIPAPLVLLSGFGPFESVEMNPSGAAAEALQRDPPPGLQVRSRVLPVSFGRAPLVWDEFLAEAPVTPALLLGLGVAKRPGFRLERRGGPRLKLVPRPDVDGRSAREFHAEGAPLETGVDLAGLLKALGRRGVSEVRISHTAGGFVCERIYHHLLLRAREQDVPGLFVHVPPLRFTPLQRQVEVVGWILEELLLGKERAQGVRSRSG